MWHRLYLIEHRLRKIIFSPKGLAWSVLVSLGILAFLETLRQIAIR